jgi:tRNA dimethylallyltransferase
LKDKLIIITGPTASGKSEIAIKVAKSFNGEIISCDSQQIYKEMDIGTNKEFDFRNIKHHMIDIINPDENFTVETFSSLVKPIVHDINNKGNIPILTGGTGFYIDSLLFEMNYGNTPKDPKIRRNLQDICDLKGSSFLYDELKEIDSKTAVKYHKNESQRIIRALEIYEITGKKPSELRKGDRVLNNDIEPILFFLNYKDRSKLYQNINNRVLKMLDAGLIDEFVYLVKKYELTKDSQSMAAIGYKELFSYFNKEINIVELVDLIQKNTRHYAKRQVTWMKKYKIYNFTHEIIMDNLSKNDASDIIINTIKDVYEF